MLCGLGNMHQWVDVNDTAKFPVQIRLGRPCKTGFARKIDLACKNQVLPGLNCTPGICHQLIVLMEIYSLWQEMGQTTQNTGDQCAMPNVSQCNIYHCLNC